MKIKKNKIKTRHIKRRSNVYADYNLSSVWYQLKLTTCKKKKLQIT